MLTVPQDAFPGDTAPPVGQGVRLGREGGGSIEAQVVDGSDAGITRDGLAPNLTQDDWDQVIDINLTGSWNAVKAVLPKMYERKEGALVFISSIVGERGNIGQANYAASKGAVISLAKALALAGARYGVRANTVAPGFIETDMLKPIPEKVQEKIIRQIPMRRFGKPEELARACAFLLTPEAGSVVAGAPER